MKNLDQYDATIAAAERSYVASRKSVERRVNAILSVAFRSGHRRASTDSRAYLLTYDHINARVGRGA